MALLEAMGSSDDYFDPDDPVQQVYALRKRSIDHQSSWREEARRAYDFRDGKQWDSEDLATLEQQSRPAVTFNRIAPILDSIVGHEMGNRQEVRYIPRTMGDGKPNETYNAGAKWVRDRCNAEDEESDAYADSLACGMGWTETRVDYEIDPNGQIVIERVPPMEMRWDPQARKHNLEDRNWQIREKWLTVREIRERWPDKADEIVPQNDTESSDDWTSDPHDASNAWQYRQDQSWFDPKKDKLLVLHYQYREREKYYRVEDPQSGEVIEFPTKRAKAMLEYLDANGIKYVQQNRWVYKQKVIAGQTMLSEGKTPIDDGFSFACITAKRDEENSTWYGLVRTMIDPQEWANKFFSQAMHIFNSNSKGGVLIEDSAVDDRRELEDNWADPEGIVWLNDGALSGGQVQQKDMGGYPSGLDKLMSFAVSSIRDVSGVNLEMLGMANRDQAGVLEVERKKAALVVLQPLANSLRRYRKIHGRMLLQFMVQYIPEGTMMRIEDQGPVPFFKDRDVHKYDVVVDTAPSSPNLKTEVWSIMQNVLPAMMKAGAPVPPDILKYSPLPESVAQEWVQYIEERSQINPEQVQQMQEQVQKLQEENQQLRSKKEETQMELMSKQQIAQMDQQLKKEEMLLKAHQAEQDRVSKMQMSDADRAAKMLEMQQTFELEMLKLRETGDLQLQISREKASVDIELAQQKLSIDRESAQEKLTSDREMTIVSLQAEREKRREEMVDRKAEREDKNSDKFSERVQNSESLAKTVDEKLDTYIDEANNRREIILGYLKDQGGEIAELAKRLA